MKLPIRYWSLLALIFFLGASSCGRDLPTPGPTYPPSRTPFQPTTSSMAVSPGTGTPIPFSSATPTTEKPLSLWVAPYLPAGVIESLALPAEIGLTAEEEDADFRLEVGEENIYSRLVYALVAPFPTISDGVTLGELRNAWGGGSGGAFARLPLMMDQKTFMVFEKWWGSPGEGAALVYPADQLLDQAWENRPAWGIVPLEALEPRWKTLTVDGLSPLWKAFNPMEYVLSVPISLYGEAELTAAVNSEYGPESASPLLPSFNRDPQRLTTLVMTGVTALVRATAWEMETQGITYPAQDVGGLLREADITHISNEVTFAEDCPYPDPVTTSMSFCSDPRYIELLEYVGADIVELTGDHLGDWGNAAMLFTLDMYDQRGWLYYGGGANLQEGRQAVTLTHNGHRFAFIGCNGKGQGFAGASDTAPGAVTCDFPWMQAEIARLTGEGYLTITTFQHYEYYTYVPQPTQVRDFRKVAGAGSVIVSGSQAHQAQGMEFYEGALVMYGLGNLFFDQFRISVHTRQALIARHVFYDGRHIGTELFTIMFVDFARPRFSTPEERVQLLTWVFEGSGW